MRRNRGERGEGQGGCIIGLLLLAVVIFGAWKIVPVKVKAAELRQMVVDEGKSAGTHNDARIRRNIMGKANELGLPLQDGDLDIKRTPTTIKINAKYVVPIEFPGFTYQYKLEHSVENPIF